MAGSTWGILAVALGVLAGCPEKGGASASGEGSPREAPTVIGSVSGSGSVAPRVVGSRKTGRTTPVCATQDCATGTIVDDGCADDGRCLSCVMACPPPAGSY